MKGRPITIFMLLMAMALRSAAQDTGKTDSIPRAYWLTLGLGASSLGGLSGIIGANAQISKTWVVTAALQPETSEAAILNFSTHDETDLATGSILIGKVIKQQHGLLLFSTGVCYGDVTYRHITGLFSTGASTSTDRPAYGVPILIQGNFVVGQCLGAGLGLYANINSQQSTAGFMVCLSLGRLATHSKQIR